jgi:hypothetical protein
MPHPCGINVKVARLRIVEKRAREAGRERIGLRDDRLGVIRILCPSPLCGHVQTALGMSARPF